MMQIMCIEVNVMTPTFSMYMGIENIKNGHFKSTLMAF